MENCYKFLVRLSRIDIFNDSLRLVSETERSASLHNHVYVTHKL